MKTRLLTGGLFSFGLLLVGFNVLTWQYWLLTLIYHGSIIAIGLAEDLGVTEKVKEITVDLSKPRFQKEMYGWMDKPEEETELNTAKQKALNKARTMGPIEKGTRALELEKKQRVERWMRGDRPIKRSSYLGR